jgi:hypothetical protein
VKIIVIVHHAGNSAQMRFSSAHTKFPKEATQAHFSRAQMNIMRPNHVVSMHNYAPKVAQVIKTR